MNAIEEFLARLKTQKAVLVRVAGTEGSAPRDAGAWMAVWGAASSGMSSDINSPITNTIGGGHLEFDAIDHARRLLAGEPLTTARRFVLGPQLGQCCGGVVDLAFETVGPEDIARLRDQLAGGSTPVALFGGGHVGKALVDVLGRLPFSVNWIDSRGEIFPDAVPDGVRCEHSEPVHLAVPALAAGTRVLIMSFSHAEDLDIVTACLKRQRERADLPYIGLIGSKTKWATFRHRLEARGFTGAELAHVTCPIGIEGIAGKEPEVIAVAVAAQLLQTRMAD